MPRFLIVCSVAAAFAVMSAGLGVAHAGPGTGPDPTTDSRFGKDYLGKDYTGDPAGALKSKKSGTPGYMGGQLPLGRDAPTGHEPTERPHDDESRAPTK